MISRQDIRTYFDQAASSARERWDTLMFLPIRNADAIPEDKRASIVSDTVDKLQGQERVFFFLTLAPRTTCSKWPTSSSSSTA